MGNLLSLVRKDEKAVSVDFYVDFENAQPTDEERDVYELVAPLLSRAPEVLRGIKSYQGAETQIRNAMNNPSPETENAAWDQLIPSVLQLKEYYEFSMELEHTLPKVLYGLFSNDAVANLEKKQALVRQFADILHFVLTFDDIKMTTPSIQNDFSYYRRTVSRMKMADPSSNRQPVSDELANRILLFYANPTPMLTAITNSTTSFVSENASIPLNNVTEGFGIIAAVCLNTVSNPEYRKRLENPDTVNYCLKVMVGVIILYDHVHKLGAFHKSSGINMKSSIKVIQSEGGEQQEGLLNCLRYTTKHLNDDETPKQIKALLS